jgi:hypothetical protein
MKRSGVASRRKHLRGEAASLEELDFVPAPYPPLPSAAVRPLEACGPSGYLVLGQRRLATTFINHVVRQRSSHRARRGLAAGMLQEPR